MEGLSAEEAAKVVIEVRALKSRLHRARMEMRERLGDVLSSGAAQSACPELAAYATDEIDQAACARIEEHLSRCRSCASACDSLKRTVSFCRQIRGDRVLVAVRAAIRAALFAASSAR